MLCLALAHFLHGYKWLLTNFSFPSRKGVCHEKNLYHAVGCTYRDR